MKYELTFWGGMDKDHVQYHETFEAAEAEAYRVLATLMADDLRTAHPALIYGPGLGDGRTIL